MGEKSKNNPIFMLNQIGTAVWAQEGQEELLHIQGQEGWLWGDTPRPR